MISSFKSRDQNEELLMSKIKPSLLDYFYAGVKRSKDKEDEDNTESEAESDNSSRSDEILTDTHTNSIVILSDDENELDDAENGYNDDEHYLDDAEIDVLTISSTSEGEEDNSQQLMQLGTSATASTYNNSVNICDTPVVSRFTTSCSSNAINRCTPKDIAVGPHGSPAQPVCAHCPLQICGKKKRSFNST